MLETIRRGAEWEFSVIGNMTLKELWTLASLSLSIFASWLPRDKQIPPPHDPTIMLYAATGPKQLGQLVID
jgi:hypothetical protein